MSSGNRQRTIRFRPDASYTPSSQPGRVQRASVEEEIANWLRKNVDLRNVSAVNEKLLGRRIEDVLSVVPVAIFTKIYPFIEKMPKTAPIFDVLLEDDRLVFPK